MFTEIVGDLFATECDYIAHGANTLGVMCAGVALQIKRRYPKEAALYTTFCQNAKPDAGEALQTFQIFHLFTQDELGPCARVGWIEAALEDMERILRQDNDYTSSIAMPRIECGIGGLSWDDVRTVIKAHAEGCDRPIVVYSLEEG